ncbi:MAG: hypothetical protein ACJAXX_001252 [Roseivirga sp.]
MPLRTPPNYRHTYTAQNPTKKPSQFLRVFIFPPRGARAALVHTVGLLYAAMIKATSLYALSFTPFMAFTLNQYMVPWLRSAISALLCEVTVEEVHTASSAAGPSSNTPNTKYGTVLESSLLSSLRQLFLSL